MGAIPQYRDREGAWVGRKIGVRCPDEAASPARLSTVSEPLAYFITIRTYGTWLHGDERGSTDPEHNAYGSPHLPPDPSWVGSAAKRMKDRPFVLGAEARRSVEAAIQERCAYAGWSVLAVNVRTNHVHVLLAASEPPEQVMTSLKAWATRRLRADGLVGGTRRVWSRHGSTVRAWNEADLADIGHYILHGQGDDLPG